MKIRNPINEQEFELNLASIIDCFTVLITYLLVSASFISLGSLDVSLANSGPGSSDSTAPVTISLLPNHSMKILGPENKKFDISASENAWDLKKLEEILKELKEKSPALQIALVNSADELEYQDLITVVEKTRQIIPVVSLGEGGS